MRTYASSGDASGLRFAVVVARFNQPVSVRLLEACTDELVKRGADPDEVDVAWVPGAFEVPLAARALAGSGRYDAIVALGAVIRGGTPHFDYVCRGVTDGVQAVMRDTEVPVAFGVLTTDDVEQALARAGGDEGNKGEEAARVAIEMAHLIVELDKRPGGRSAGRRRARAKGRS
ncbi:MAG: 6,7-dimethyl-8-ribityllumazine synthase [Myxococcota bacterium]